MAKLASSLAARAGHFINWVTAPPPSPHLCSPDLLFDSCSTRPRAPLLEVERKAQTRYCSTDFENLRRRAARQRCASPRVCTCPRQLSLVSSVVVSTAPPPGVLGALLQRPVDLASTWHFRGRQALFQWPSPSPHATPTQPGTDSCTRLSPLSDWCMLAGVARGSLARPLQPLPPPAIAGAGGEEISSSSG